MVRPLEFKSWLERLHSEHKTGPPLPLTSTDFHSVEFSDYECGFGQTVSGSRPTDPGT